MGSLMAGWDSNILDPQVVKYKRNKSLTKEEIEAFWRSKKHKEEADTSVLSPRSHIQANSTFDEEAAKSNFGEILGMKNEENSDNLIKKHGWWVSSSLAHLNEPPVLAPEDVTTYKHMVSRFKHAHTG